MFFEEEEPGTRIQHSQGQSLHHIAYELMAALECESLGISQNNNDMALSLVRKQHRAAIMLIRPHDEGGNAQLCFLFGGKKMEDQRSYRSFDHRVYFQGTKKR